MSPPLHIGLLLCHTFAPILQQVGGLNYSAIFRQQFLNIDHNIRFTDFNAYECELPSGVDQCDVWLINGSPAGAYDDLDWIHQLSDFIEQLNEAYMQPQANTIDVMVFHQDQVVQLPEGARVLASSEFCPNYMVQYNPHMLSIQGHPEFNTQMVEGVLCGPSFDHRPAVRAQGMANSAGTPDTQLLFQWVVNFYRQAASLTESG